MGPNRLLRHLDEVVVPRLARGFARLSRGRLRPRLLTASALFAVTAVLITAVWAAHQDAPVGDLSVGDTVRVGVVQGQSIPGYTAATRTELKHLVEGSAAMPVETYALVSLRAYLAPDRLTPVLGGVSVIEVYARVPLPQTQTQIVRIPAFRIPQDVIAGMRQVATRKDVEASGYLGLAAKLRTTDAEEDHLRTVYLSGATVAAAEATAYRSGCTCVYAAVVRASPAALEQISARPEVRAVDPAPEVRRLDRAVFLPPLPEQQGEAHPPVDGSPSPTVSVSPSGRPSSPSPAPTPSITPAGGGADPSGTPRTPAPGPSA